ncbi:hypothetical protein ACIF8T_21555 [Streptomyces sp. NPDC085946]|uniref:hypothetical protein n=1 Tax=Streptomyces sp. NPDC085946 TaxID=3365744 RepID=UPI0037CD6460
MPSLSTLQDNFNDGVIGPVWGNSYGGVTETGGQARVPCGTGFAGYQTAYSWTMAGASFFVKIGTVPTAGAATECYCGVLVNSPTAGTRIGFTINAVAGLLRCKNDVGYFDSGVVEIAYNPATMAFLRLREDAGTVYWDTSPDGTTWTNRRSLATPAWVTTEIDTCALDMSAHRNAGTTDVATYDLFNTLANGAVHSGTAALTANSSLAATALVAVHASSDLSADSELAATPTLSARETVALSAQATLTADADSSQIPEVAALAAGDWDLVIEQGATFVQTYTVTDDPDFTWAGWTARAQIRSAPADSGDLLLDLTPFLTIIGASIRLAIPAAQTQTLTRNGVWDLEVVQGGTVVRLLNGKAIVSPEVTRA